MTTINTTAIVGPDWILSVQLPNDVLPGEHQVVIVLNGKASPAHTLSPPHPVGPANPAVTYRREEIYGDDGR
jgi:hypothetical protein